MIEQVTAVVYDDFTFGSKVRAQTFRPKAEFANTLLFV